MLQLAARTVVLAGLVPITGGGKMVQAADQLFLLTRKAEDWR